jgi:hypothetical protein
MQFNGISPLSRVIIAAARAGVTTKLRLRVKS